MTTSSPIPAVRDDDPEDVSWALSTAQTQWTRGDRIEALKWLRRAAEAASEAEKDTRALELAKAAAELTTPSMPPPSVAPPPSAPRSGPPPIPMAPPSRPPPIPAAPLSRPPPMVTPKAPPAAVSSSKIPPAPVSSKPMIPPAPRSAPPPPKKKSADETSKRAAAKAKPDVRPRPPSREDRTDTNIVTEVTRLDTKPPTNMTDSAPTEADGWPTESMKSGELESLQGEQVYGQQRTRIGAPAYRKSEPPPGQNVPFRASQAVHVILWRDGDGHLRVAPRGTTVSAVTIEALLVAPSADVDLLAWLSSD